MIKELKRDDCFLEFDDFENMSAFLHEMNSADVWDIVSMYGSKVKEVIPGSEVERDSFISCDEDLDFLEQHGGLYLATSGCDYIVSPVSFFTMKQRLGVNCKAATRMLDKKEYTKFAAFANIAFSMVDEKDVSSILLRGGRVIAMHSGKYDVHNQDELLATTQDYIDKKFANSEFVKGSYSHTITMAEWSLGGKNSPLTKAYVKAWEDADLDVESLKDFHPMVAFATSDIGVQSIEYYPMLKMGKRMYPVGTPLKLKHYGGKSINDVEETLEMVFSAIKKGSEGLSEMLKIKMEYPVEAFVAASKKVGLNKVIPKLLKNQLEIEKITYEFDSDSNAFLVYDAINNVTSSDKYKSLSNSTKMKVQEGLSRLLVIDWAKLDKPGYRDFD